MDILLTKISPPTAPPTFTVRVAPKTRFSAKNTHLSTVPRRAQTSLEPHPSTVPRDTQTSLEPHPSQIKFTYFAPHFPKL